MRRPLPKRLPIIALEPRFLFDGAGAVTATKTAADTAAAHTLTVPQAQALAAVLAANVPPAVEARAADGTFQSAVTYTTGSVPRAVMVGDVNNDGKLDLVVANRTSSTVSVLLGNGIFQAKTDYVTGTYPFNLSIGDMNGDGKLDVVSVCQGTSTVTVALNTTSTGPSVSAINRHTGAAAANNATTEVFDVAFSAAVTGVATGKFSLSGSGVTGTIASITDSGDHINYRRARSAISR